MRYNIFNKAHLPLKRALLACCISIDKLRQQEQDNASEVLQKVDEVLNLYDEQIAYESLHILPFIFEYEPSISVHYTNEHNKITSISKHLKGWVQTYYKQKRLEDKRKIMGLISETFNEFVLSNFNHMDDEEPVLNEILWRYYPDPVLIQLEEKMEILPHLVQKQYGKTGLQIATAA